MTHQFAIPLGYFITFTCYGTWLHGGKPISVDKKNNIPLTNFLPLNLEKAKETKKRMREEAYLLNQQQRELALDSIMEVCKYKKWVLFAAHVRTNHIHIVIHSMEQPEQVMSTIKAYASRALKSNDTQRTKFWTRHGSTQYLWKEGEMEAAINYVVNEQGERMAVFENKDRVAFFDAFVNY